MKKCSVVLVSGLLAMALGACAPRQDPTMPEEIPPLSVSDVEIPAEKSGAATKRDAEAETETPVAGVVDFESPDLEGMVVQCDGTRLVVSQTLHMEIEGVDVYSVSPSDSSTYVDVELAPDVAVKVRKINAGTESSEMLEGALSDIAAEKTLHLWGEDREEGFYAHTAVVVVVV